MYKKISIVGAPGTGKTTLANKLSEILQIEATHIDGLHYLPNWQIRDKSERDTIILNIVKKDKWIIDGTYKSTLKARFESADLIIWLDFSTINQLKGILNRYIKNKGIEKVEIPGCKEKMDIKFFLYVLRYNKTKRNFIVENLGGIDENKLLILKNRKSVNKWINTLRELEL